MKGKRPGKKGGKPEEKKGRGAGRSGGRKAGRDAGTLTTAAATSEVYPASLVARLAEAVDGVRDGRAHWWLITLAFPHRRPRFFDSYEEAAAARNPAEESEPLGPYVNGPKGREKKRVKSITITYEDGTQRTGSGKDAVLLSEAAVEKFVIPYYTHVLGVDEAQKMWTTYLESDEPVLCHEPLSDPVDCGDPDAYKSLSARKAKKSRT